MNIIKTILMAMLIIMLPMVTAAPVVLTADNTAVRSTGNVAAPENTAKRVTGNVVADVVNAPVTEKDDSQEREDYEKRETEARIKQAREDYLAEQRRQYSDWLSSEQSINTFDTFSPSDFPIRGSKVADVKERIGASAAEIEEIVNNSPEIHHFLMWTKDGKNVLYGKYANGYFMAEHMFLEGTMYGIYNGGVFAGVYEGGFFYGLYHNGQWKAKSVFGNNYAQGGFTLFP